jgi:hypothetical protein
MEKIKPRPGRKLDYKKHSDMSCGYQHQKQDSSAFNVSRGLIWPNRRRRALVGLGSKAVSCVALGRERKVIMVGHQEGKLEGWPGSERLGPASTSRSTTSAKRSFFGLGSIDMSLRNMRSRSWSFLSRPSSVNFRFRSSSRFRESSNDRLKRASDSRAIISARRALASACSSSDTRPRNRPLINSSSLTRVFNDVFAARSPSYVCGTSRCRSVEEDVEPGDGFCSCKEERLAVGLKPCSPSVTESNMLCGAI